MSNNKMTPQLAKQVVNEAINIAMAKGCFGLLESTNIVMALQFINSQPDVEFGEVTEEVLTERPAPKK
jgi:hypothetical protein